MSEDPLRSSFIVFLPSLICLAPKSVKAVAGSEIYRLSDDFSVPD